MNKWIDRWIYRWIYRYVDRYIHYFKKYTRYTYVSANFICKRRWWWIWIEDMNEYEWVNEWKTRVRTRARLHIDKWMNLNELNIMYGWCLIRLLKIRQFFINKQVMDVFFFFKYMPTYNNWYFWFCSCVHLSCWGWFIRTEKLHEPCKP